MVCVAICRVQGWPRGEVLRYSPRRKGRPETCVLALPWLGLAAHLPGLERFSAPGLSPRLIYNSLKLLYIRTDG